MERCKWWLLVLLVVAFIASQCYLVYDYTRDNGASVTIDTVRVTVVDTISYYLPVASDSAEVGSVVDRLAVVKNPYPPTGYSPYLLRSRGRVATSPFLGEELQGESLNGSNRSNRANNSPNAILDNRPNADPNESNKADRSDKSTPLVLNPYPLRVLPLSLSGSGRVSTSPLSPNGTGAKNNVQDSVDVVIPIEQRVYRDSTYTAYVSGYRPRLDSLFVYPHREVMTIRERVVEKSKVKRWGVGIQVGYGVTLQDCPRFSPYIGVGISYNLFSF